VKINVFEGVFKGERGKGRKGEREKRRIEECITSLPLQGNAKGKGARIIRI